jgi:hypothetical protein
VLQRVDRELAAMVAGCESDWVGSSLEAGEALSTCRMATSSLVGWLIKLSRTRSPINHPTAIANGIPVSLTACRSPLKQIHSPLKQIHINRNRSQCQALKATPRAASKRHAGFARAFKEVRKGGGAAPCSGLQDRLSRLDRRSTDEMNVGWGRELRVHC